LKDVVVVGYGTQRKSDITGAISSIKGSDLTQLSTQRVDQALQGRAAGVMVLNTDGAPGGNTTIRVRGSNSINGGNNALIVIDGLQGGNLNSLNPNDIESIEVLKDASATAIYGAQGANGVVLITTKLGKKGKPVISYNYSYGVSKLRKKLDVMNAADFAKTINAAVLTQNGSGATPVPIFSEAEIQNYEKNGGTDWQDVIYRTAPIQNHELSISGGTDNMKYLVSGGYLNQQGILINSEYQRFSLRANIKTDINKWSGFGLSWAGSKEAGNSPPFGSADISFLGNSVNVAPRWAPTEPIYDSLGKLQCAQVWVWCK
jgi:TonB-dependent SusC/RagA subfamily outer membrane receptor